MGPTQAIPRTGFKTATILHRIQDTSHNGVNSLKQHMIGLRCESSRKTIVIAVIAKRKPLFRERLTCRRNSATCGSAEASKSNSSEIGNPLQGQRRDVRAQLKKPLDLGFR